VTGYDARDALMALVEALATTIRFNSILFSMSNPMELKANNKWVSSTGELRCETALRNA
jgi:hypothetical protein